MSDPSGPQFSFAAGSVVGHDHVRRGPMFVGMNNQDAHLVGRSVASGCIVGVVSDGCSQHERSELGAMVSASSVWKSLCRDVPPSGETNVMTWQAAKSNLVSSLSAIGIMLAYRLEDYAHATVIGFVIGEEWTTIFHIGDGFHCVNGDLVRVLPMDGSYPPYPIYDTLVMPIDDDLRRRFEEQIGERPFDFRTIVHPTSEVDSILVASDGLRDLLDVEGDSMPFQPSQKVPHISSFWTDDTWFDSRYRLRQFLAACNNATVRPDGAGGVVRRPALLSDDTTIVVARRSSDGVE